MSAMRPHLDAARRNCYRLPVAVLPLPVLEYAQSETAAEAEEKLKICASQSQSIIPKLS